MAVAQQTPRWQLTGADEPRYIEGVATTLVLRFKVRAHVQHRCRRLDPREIGCLQESAEELTTGSTA